jgi:hypothetical protein
MVDNVGMTERGKTGLWDILRQQSVSVSVWYRSQKYLSLLKVPQDGLARVILSVPKRHFLTESALGAELRRSSCLTSLLERSP